MYDRILGGLIIFLFFLVLVRLKRKTTSKATKYENINFQDLITWNDRKVNHSFMDRSSLFDNDIFSNDDHKINHFDTDWSDNPGYSNLEGNVYYHDDKY